MTKKKNIKKETKVLVNNTIMMYIMSIAKIIIPLVSLPYLTRVLSVDCYGSVSFVKSIISYVQIIIDFGFLLSATKDIVLLLKNGQETSEKIGNTLYARILLCIFAFIPFIIITFCLRIMKGYEIFALLYFLNSVLTIFLFEYVFRAYQKMGKISIRYVIMKLISLALTLIFIKGDADIILMPIFDIVATIIAIIMVGIEMKKMGVSINFNFRKIKEAFIELKSSFIYFLSNFAGTAFSILNTLIIGIFLDKTDVAYWSLALQVIGVIQTFYDPIINSVYPVMIEKKELNYIHKILMIYMPLIFIGCVLIILLGDWAVTFVFGDSYLEVSRLIKLLIPLIIISFPAMLYGWPCLGPINKQNQATLSSIIAAIIQVIGLVFLAIIHQFNLIGIIIVRNVTEFSLFVIRFTICYKNKSLFDKNNIQDKDDLSNEILYETIIDSKENDV